MPEFPSLNCLLVVLCMQFKGREGVGICHGNGVGVGVGGKTLHGVGLMLNGYIFINL